MVSWNLLTKCTNCYRGSRGVISVATLNSLINFGALLRKIRILKFDLLIFYILLLLMKLLIKSNNMSNRVNTKASKSSIKCMLQQNRYSILVFLYGNRGATKIITVLCKHLIQKYYILVTFLPSVSNHASFFPEKNIIKCDMGILKSIFGIFLWLFFYSNTFEWNISMVQFVWQ